MFHSTSASTDSPAIGESAAPDRRARLIAWILIALGVLIRVALFATNRPLWLDEAQLAVNFVELDHHELARPGVLIYNQGAPVGYLLAVKTCSELFGTGEMALRLVALLAGIASILVFHRLAARVLPTGAALIALGLFCFSEPLIYFSNEVKPYGLDVLVSMLYCWLGLRIWQEGERWFDIAMLAVAGAATVWFSMPSIFTFGGVSMALAGRALAGRRWGALAAVCAAAAIFLVAYYINFDRFIAEKSKTYAELGLNRYYSRDGRYVPFPPRSFTDVAWYGLTPLHYFVDPLGFRVLGIALVASLVGFTVLWRRHRLLAAMLTAPLALSLLAAVVKMYPFFVSGEQGPIFNGRLSLFTAPYALLFIALGLGQAWTWLRGYGKLAMIGGIAALAVHPGHRLAQQFLHPPGTQEIRQPLEHLRQHHLAGDAIYLHWVAQPIYRYYAARMSLPTDGRIGLDRAMVEHMIDANAWVRDEGWRYTDPELAKARGKRVWLVFVHHPATFSYADEKYLYRLAEGWGRRLDRVETRGASVTLFDLRPAVNLDPR